MTRQSVYVPDDMRAELRAEAQRLQRTYGWLMRRAWELARDQILAMAVAPEEVVARPSEDRFWEKVRKGEGDACWEWTGGVAGKGHGTIWFNDRKVYAHRFSWVLHFGAIPDGLWVLHRCDNPPCVRPDHLFLGTVQDNHDDMHAKGRAADTGKNALRGEASPTARLTAEQVKTIYFAYHREGRTMAALATEFGVDPSTVRSVVRLETWRDVLLPLVAEVA